MAHKDGQMLPHITVGNSETTLLHIAEEMPDGLHWWAEQYFRFEVTTSPASQQVQRRDLASFLHYMMTEERTDHRVAWTPRLFRNFQRSCRIRGSGRLSSRWRARPSVDESSLCRGGRSRLGWAVLAADIEQAGENIVAARRDLTWEAPETEAGLLGRANGRCCVNLEVGDGALLGRHSVARTRQMASRQPWFARLESAADHSVRLGPAR